jgi:type IV pilus assembly protein PilV
MTSAERCPRRRSSRGSTLLEVLVAVLILSIGLLGVAGLQAASLRYEQGGWARAAVAAGLSNLAERVRSNPDALPNAYLLQQTYAVQRAAMPLTEDTTSCVTAICAPADLATVQMTNWRAALDQSLPGSAAYVTGDRSTGYQVTVMWADKNVAVSAATCAATDAGVAQRTCCPTAAAAPAGVRCTNFMLVP